MHNELVAHRVGIINGLDSRVVALSFSLDELGALTAHIVFEAKRNEIETGENEPNASGKGWKG